MTLGHSPSDSPSSRSASSFPTLQNQPRPKNRCSHIPKVMIPRTFAICGWKRGVIGERNLNLSRLVTFCHARVALSRWSAARVEEDLYSTKWLNTGGPTRQWIDGWLLLRVGRIGRGAGGQMKANEQSGTAPGARFPESPAVNGKKSC